MSERVKMLSRIDNSETSPFLLCNLLALRARQLATRQSAKVSPRLINAAFLQFLEGKLDYELNGRSTHSAGVPNRSGGAKNENDSRAGASGEPSRRKFQPALESADRELAVPVNG